MRLSAIVQMILGAANIVVVPFLFKVGEPIIALCCLLIGVATITNGFTLYEQ